MEGVIGFVWRYGNNDYGIEITDFDKKDEKILMDMYTKYGEADKFSGCRENAQNCNLESANVAYWEEKWSAKSREEKRKNLAKKIYNVCLKETNIFYDDREDYAPTLAEIKEDLETYKGTAYILEAIVQFCDGSQSKEDHKIFYELTLDIVHYMENMKVDNDDNKT